MSIEQSSDPPIDEEAAKGDPLDTSELGIIPPEIDDAQRQRILAPLKKPLAQEISTTWLPK